MSAIDFKDKSIKVIQKTPEEYVRQGWDVNYIVFRDNCKRGNYFYEDEINPDKVNVIRKYWPLEKTRDSNNIVFRLLMTKLASLLVIIKLFTLGWLYLIKNKDCNFVYGYEMQGVLASNLLKLFFLHRKIFYISRFQGVFYIKEHINNKRYLSLLFNVDTFLALWLPSDLMIMTNDGTQGDKVLEKIKSRGLKSFLFISNGVDSPGELDKQVLCDKYGLSIDNEFILMVSRLEKIKRVHLALEALVFLNQKGMSLPYKLVIIGDGSEFDSLKRYTSDFKISEYVVFLGPISNVEVYSFMKMSKMVLSLYESSNIGNPFFESMSIGIPFIAVNNGDTSNFVSHLENGYLLSEDNIIPDLVDFFKNISKNSALLSQMEKGTEKYSKQYILSWSERISKEINLINKLSSRNIDL